jgi:high affinity Mn2+ porin
MVGFPFASPARYDSQYDLHRFRVGLNYHFGGSDGEAKEGRPSDDRGPGTWELHGQTTFIMQGYPPIRSPYEGANSLPGIGQSRETWSASAFLGVRLWQGGELYYNPELLQGFGIADTTGAGGYPQGEAQKSNFPFPRYSTSRLFVRQETIGRRARPSRADGPAVKRKIYRLTFQVGRFSARCSTPIAMCRARLPQLVSLGGRRLRLSRRSHRPHLRRHCRVEPAELGRAGRLLPGR